MVRPFAAAILLAASFPGLPDTGNAHPGGLNAQGCHNDRKAGEYHCHGKTQPAPRNTPRPGAYFANCDAARAAGVAPLRRGQPGYRQSLDRDDDGVACEPRR